MREMYHDNIINLKEAYVAKADSAFQNKGIYLYIVMDYVPETLNRIISHHNSIKSLIPMIYVKLYAYQILRALAYLHALGLCHRDIKPSNCLVDPVTN
tara:strand:+ start:258 stop:551 length:294 start_codon:yes stop_codon:yes gene_type:complete